jgi:molybdenum cofactor synthesis domain-containing protein
MARRTRPQIGGTTQSGRRVYLYLCADWDRIMMAQCLIPEHVFMSERIFTAAVIIIGNEILSGRTQDTNLRDISTSLGVWGIRVMEARVIPDVEDTIVAVVNELRAAHDYVLTTGGIGPTHDDITAACIAKAFGVPLVQHPQIAALIRRHSEAPPDIMASRLRMAMVPEGAGLIENSTGGPPGFFIGNVYVMAGIPAVMRAMLASLQSRLTGGAVMQSRSVTAFLGESTIARELEAIQRAHPEIEIGSYPFMNAERHGTTLVMRGTDEALIDIVAAKVEAMVLAAGEYPQHERPAAKN